MNTTYQWWGFRLRLSHEETQEVLEALDGGGTTAVAARLGTMPWLAAIVAAAVGLAALWIRASDDGNGVALYCAWWTGWFWVENPAAWA